MSQQREPIKIFISYAPEDASYLLELEKHLALLRKQGWIEAWHARKVGPGGDWRGTIDAELEAAQIILLLVSSDFIHSNYCFDVEMERAMARQRATDDAVVIPVIVRVCDWESAPFGKLRALPDLARPVSKWEDRDEAFTDIAKDLRAIAGRMSQPAVINQTIGPAPDGYELVAIGPDIIAWGRLLGTHGSVWSLHLQEPFLAGDTVSLTHLSDSFEGYPRAERYIACEAHGGRLLAKPPRWTRTRDGLTVELEVQPFGPRTDPHALPPEMKLRLDEVQPGMGRGDSVSGIDIVPQRLTILLSTCKGGWGYGASFGSRIAELNRRLGATSLQHIVAMELVRLATVPHVDSLTKKVSILLGFVDRVRSVEVIHVDVQDWVRVRLVLDLHGLQEPWRGVVSASLSTKFLDPRTTSWPTALTISPYET